MIEVWISEVVLFVMKIKVYLLIVVFKMRFWRSSVAKWISTCVI